MLVLCFVDLAVLLLVAEAGWILRLRQIGLEPAPIWKRAPQLITFALAIQSSMIGVGVYAPESLKHLRFAAARLLVAISLGVMLMSLLFFVLPDSPSWRSTRSIRWCSRSSC